MRFPLLAALAALALTQPVQAQADVLAEVEERGVLRMCMAEWNPFAFKDPNTNEWQGVNPALAGDFAEHLGVELEFVDTNWSAFPVSLQTGQCDVLFGDLAVTPERDELVDFAEPMLSMSYAVAVHRDSEAAAYADVDQAGTRVGSFAGSAIEAVARDFFEQAEVLPIVTDQTVGPLLELANRRVDAAFMDTFTAVNFINNNANVPVRLLEQEPINPDPLSYVVAEGEAGLLAALNEFLAEAKKSGRYEALVTEWVGELPEGMLDQG